MASSLASSVLPLSTHLPTSKGWTAELAVGLWFSGSSNSGIMETQKLQSVQFWPDSESRFAGISNVFHLRVTLMEACLHYW